MHSQVIRYPWIYEDLQGKRVHYNNYVTLYWKYPNEQSMTSENLKDNEDSAHD